MKRSRIALAPLAVCLASGCVAEDPDPASIEGATAQEAADIVAEVGCQRYAECGIISASCTPCPIGEPDCEPQCTVAQRDYPEGECLEDLREDLETGFGCQELTSEAVATVDECLAQAPAQACPSVQDVEAWVEGGRQGRDPREPLAACDLLYDDIIFRCGQGE